MMLRILLLSLLSIFVCPTTYALNGGVDSRVDASKEQGLLYQLSWILSYDPEGAVPGALGRAICSGTFIDKDMVLTAAHCVKGTTDRVHKAKSSLVIAKAIHPLAGREQFDGQVDLAILLLKDAIDTAKPARLASQPPLSKQDAIATGFGRTGNEHENGILFEWGKVAHITAITDNEGRNPFIGVENVLCKGDSGGGLFAKKGDELELIGVNSSGIAGSKCGEFSLGFIVPVYPHLDWIKNTAAKLRRFKDSPR